MQRVPAHPKRDTQGAVCDEGAFILLGGVLRPIGDRVKKQHPNYCRVVGGPATIVTAFVVLKHVVLANRRLYVAAGD
jgi:hypothetical protein